MTFKLKSPAFKHREPIPVKDTADGENVSPPLQWTDPPEGTKSFVLVVEDPHAPAGIFRLWGLYNIPADTRALPEGFGSGRQNAGFGLGINDFGRPKYAGPAPPKGHGRHHYHFKLAALDVNKLSPSPRMKVADIWKYAQAHKLGEAELVGTYERR
jgi:Raf kinase inhibitor-like YbhB/YbcL family protein